MTLKETILNKLKNNSNGCLEWQGYRNEKGYGKITFKGKTYRVHRILWEETNGSILEGMFVCHKCDNPACANIEHLFLGTHQDNTDDKVKKGRAVRKVNKELSQQIRNETGSYNELAKKYNLSSSTVWEIKNKIWKYL